MDNVRFDKNHICSVTFGEKGPSSVQGVLFCILMLQTGTGGTVLGVGGGAGGTGTGAGGKTQTRHTLAFTHISSCVCDLIDVLVILF